MIITSELQEGQSVFKAFRDCETREWEIGEILVERIWKTPKRENVRIGVRAVNFTDGGADKWTLRGLIVRDYFKTPLAAVENAIWKLLRPDAYECGYRSVTIGGYLEEEVRLTENLFALWRELRRAQK